MSRFCWGLCWESGWCPGPSPDPALWNVAPGLAQTPPHTSRVHTHWTQHHPPLGCMFVSPPLAVEAHGYSSFVFSQFSHHGKSTGGLEMVLTNCLFLFRLTGFQSLRHRGMWLFYSAFVFRFLHLFYKANKGKKKNNKPTLTITTTKPVTSSSHATMQWALKKTQTN